MEMVLQIRDVEQILISADLKQQRTWPRAPYLGRQLPDENKIFKFPEYSTNMWFRMT